MCEQTCADCRGVGYQLVGFTGTMPRFGDSLCPTCDGTGAILRTGPYRLADGTWSDGVDRRIEIHDRIPPQNRWQVYQCESGYWEACAESDGQQLDEIDSFPTHAEAIAYADRMARGGA